MNHDLPVGRQAEAIWREAWRILLNARSSVAAFLGLMIGAGVLIDTQGWGPPAEYALMAVDVLASFALTMILIQTTVPGGRRGHRGFFTYFGLSFVTGIGIGFGFLMLIVPGLVLWARWAPSAGFALAEDMEMYDAVGKSWEATRDHTGPILLAHLPAFVAGIGGFAIVYSAFEETGPVPLTLSLAANALGFGSLTLGIVLGLAVFTLLARDGSPEAG